jgi:hypothetical protein
MPIPFAASAPPVRKTAATATKTVAKSPANPNFKTREELRQEGVEGILGIGQIITMGLGQLAAAETIQMHTPTLAPAYAAVGEANEGFGSMLDKAADIGPYAIAAAVTAPFVIQMLVNFGVLKYEKFAGMDNIKSPDELKATALNKARIMQEQAKQKAMAAKQMLDRAMAETAAMNEE